MKTKDLEKLGLELMSDAESRNVAGGCWGWLWCPERIVAELKLAREVFIKSMEEGFRDFDVH
jgi:hypothetical protein